MIQKTKFGLQIKGMHTRSIENDAQKALHNKRRILKRFWGVGGGG